MKSETVKIEEIARKLSAENNLILVDVVLRGSPASRVVEIFIDGERNISAEDCALFSRQMLKIIEQENLFKSGFRLDVSTPGIERPLKYLKQFPKHINRNFEIIYSENDEKKKITGKLLAVEDNSLYFSTKESESLKIDFNRILQARVLISFS
ncbi:MAG: ribosome maturation factor RimP [Ignavibacteriaceae bacterium]